MNRYCALLAASILLSAGPWLAATAQSATPAPARSTQVRAPSATQPASIELGKVNVTAMRRMIETLQQVKVALRRPFDDNPKHVNDMVCRLHVDASVHSVAHLECGNEGWFSSRRDIVSRALGGGWVNAGQEGMERAFAANSEAGNGPSPEYGHPWHSVRTLTPTQLMYVRQILNALPAPGQGEVTVFDKNGKTVMVIKPDKSSGKDGSD